MKHKNINNKKMNLWPQEERQYCLLGNPGNSKS